MKELIIVFYTTGSNSTKGWVEPSQPPDKSHPAYRYIFFIYLGVKWSTKGPQD